MIIFRKLLSVKKKLARKPNQTPKLDIGPDYFIFLYPFFFLLKGNGRVYECVSKHRPQPLTAQRN